MQVSCLAAKGFQYSTIYLPDSRFWPVQGAETAALLALTVWWVIRQIS